MNSILLGLSQSDSFPATGPAAILAREGAVLTRRPLNDSGFIATRPASLEVAFRVTEPPNRNFKTNTSAVNPEHLIWLATSEC